ncbi:acyl-CoA N-acyltransferase [Apiospora sp. TS-2023a]
MDDTSSSSSSFQRSQAAAAQGQRSVITILPRTADDLAALARIFEATFEASGYPVEGPPALDPAAAPALVEYFSGPPAQERCGFVAVEDIDARTATTAQRSGSSAQTPTSPPRRKVLGHVSLRRVHPHSIEFRLWNAFREGPPATTPTSPAATDSCLWGVSRLAIDPAEQKRGIGGCLMEYVERQARQAGKTLVLGVLHKDVAAIRMYERRGWVRFGQQEGFAGRDGRLWTMYYYGLYNDAALP